MYLSKWSLPVDALALVRGVPSETLIRLRHRKKYFTSILKIHANISFTFVQALF